MAKKVETIVTLTDDMDGSKADRTVEFTYAGTAYEIDLNKKNASALDKALAPYVAAARKAPTLRSTRRSRATGPTSRRPDLAAVREWARSNGHSVSDRGRIPASVLEAYDAAQ
ncbi:MAG: hypothetical protein DLM57_08075 [Pseudonocardiales bacterium]|nr:MAG: hypothetical protein DLM57_08075 [Pseudonocardiales bacterium]